MLVRFCAMAEVRIVADDVSALSGGVVRSVTCHLVSATILVVVATVSVRMACVYVRPGIQE